MDIMAKVQEVVSKITSDKDFKENFEKDPVKAVESILGVDLPDEIINKVIDSAKAGISADSVSGIASKIGELFGKN